MRASKNPIKMILCFILLNLVSLYEILKRIPGLRYVFSMVDRSIKDCPGKRQFGKTEKEKVLEFFFHGKEPECVFCGCKDIKRWNHLIPITNGCETVPGNMVPACSRCDDSIQAFPFENWLKSKEIPDKDQRIKLIKSYMHHFNYVPKSLEERLNEKRLNESELIRLKTIQSKLEEITDGLWLLL